MKLAKVRIENVRHIQDLTLDFTDSLGQVRDVSLIVGPNTSGKTTILDAIGIGLGIATGFSYQRPGFTLNIPAFVRRGALDSKVTYWIRFTDKEIITAKELNSLVGESQQISDLNEVQVTWSYPDRNWQFVNGRIFCKPYKSSLSLFKSRELVARLLSTGRVDWNWFKRVGTIISFDQQRRFLEKTIPADVWDIINYGKPEEIPEDRRTSDPKTILLSLAIRDSIQAAINSPQGQFKQIQERYADICAPHRLEGAIQNELGQLDLKFSDGNTEYNYEGLSSGEQMILLFLIRMVSEHIHQSIVLIDEIELHQHPLWQRRLLYLLPKMGINNQIIATTHSDYLRDVAPPGSVIDLGNLGTQEENV